MSGWWRNITSCMCSVTVTTNGVVVDKTGCPIHGKVKGDT